MRRSISSSWGVRLRPTSIHGVDGIFKLSPGAAAQVDTLLVELLAQPGNRKAGIPHLLQTLPGEIIRFGCCIPSDTGWMSTALTMWFAGNF